MTQDNFVFREHTYQLQENKLTDRDKNSSINP